MKQALKLLVTMLLIAYPAAVYFGLLRFGVAPLAWLLLVAGLLRLMLARRDRSLWPAGLVAVAIGGASALLHSLALLRYYPVLINFAGLLVFGLSLRHPPTVVERLARLTEPNMSPAAVAWTRRVSQVWCAFFAANGVAALYTARYASLQVWTLYNGFIAYLLMALLFGSEYLLRRRHRQRIA